MTRNDHFEHSATADPQVGTVLCWRLLVLRKDGRTFRTEWEVSVSRVGIAIIACRPNACWIWYDRMPGKITGLIRKRLDPAITIAEEWFDIFSRRVGPESKVA